MSKFSTITLCLFLNVFALNAFANGPGFNGGLQLYFPLITEEGAVNFDNYSNVLRFNLYFNLGGLKFD